MARNSFRQVRVVFPGGLTPTEHAIAEAHAWQVKHAAENTPIPSEAYTVIVGLLLTFPDGVVEAAIRKARV
jgi:hypothetical protein